MFPKTQYRTVFANVGLTGNPYFIIQVNYGSGWVDFQPCVYSAEEAKNLIEKVIAGERVWTVTPIQVTKTIYG
jgi:hypothetical protein